MSALWFLAGAVTGVALSLTAVLAFIGWLVHQERKMAERADKQARQFLANAMGHVVPDDEVKP